MTTRHLSLIRSRSLLSLTLVASLAGAVFAGSAAAQSDPAPGPAPAPATTAAGRHVRPSRHGFRERHAKRGAIAHELGLTPEQREQVRSAVKTNRPAMEQARQSVHAAADTLRAALAASPRDPATVAAAHVALDQARDNGKATRESRRSAMGAALTPEQREQLEAKLESCKARKTGHTRKTDRGQSK